MTHYKVLTHSCFFFLNKRSKNKARRFNFVSHTVQFSTVALWSDSCLFFFCFFLQQTPKERPPCPSSHYPGKQKEMSGSISCGPSRLFQLHIGKRRRESMESATEKNSRAHVMHILQFVTIWKICTYVHIHIYTYIHTRNMLTKRTSDYQRQNLTNKWINDKKNNSKLNKSNYW